LGFWVIDRARNMDICWGFGLLILLGIWIFVGVF